MGRRVARLVAGLGESAHFAVRLAAMQGDKAREARLCYAPTNALWLKNEPVGVACTGLARELIASLRPLASCGLTLGHARVRSCR